MKERMSGKKRGKPARYAGGNERMNTQFTIQKLKLQVH